MNSFTVSICELYMSSMLLSSVSSQSTSLYCIYEEECNGLFSDFSYNKIYCYGDESCTGSELSTSGTIFSYGNSATSNSILSSGSTVDCYGPNSCSNSIISSDTVRCWSSESCSSMESNSSTVQLVGYQSGIGSYIQYPIGSQSGIIKGYSSQSAKFADIINPYAVVALSLRSFDNADIMVTGTGFNSFVLESFAPNGFRGANVYCGSGVYCMFSCIGSGCRRLTIHILTGGSYQIDYSYPDCDDRATIIESNSTTNDALILDYYQKRSHIKSLVRKEVNDMINDKHTNNMDNFNLGDLWDKLFDKYANTMKLYENENEIMKTLKITKFDVDEDKIQIKGEARGVVDGNGIKLKFLYVLLGSVIVAILFVGSGLMITLLKYIYTYIGDISNNGYDEIKSGKTYNVYNGFKYQSI